MSGIKTITWRNEKISSLVLGTVQFGLDYGIANSNGKPSTDDTLQIVKRALDCGITFFDTAQAYGDSETVLGRALNSLEIAGSAKVISKISPTLSRTDFPAIFASVEESIGKLGVKQLWGLMLHRAEWLDGWNSGLGKTLENLRKDGKTKYIGVSVYTPAEAKCALATDGIDMIQVPCSVWDRRMISSGIFEIARKMDKLCFVRSIYLQGLLLMSPEQVEKKLPAAVKASKKWNSIAEKHGMTKAELAAKFAISLERPIVVGMESSSQVKENLELFSKSGLTRKTIDEIGEEMAPFLNDDILNPSKWKPVI